MVIHKLSFCSINKLNDHIAEVVVNKNVEISLEMAEEVEQSISELFEDSFGILVNKINVFKYDYETKLIIGSHKNLKAISVVNYHNEGVAQSNRIVKLRKMDDLNVRIFSGLDLGWQQGVDWLEKELSVIS